MNKNRIGAIALLCILHSLTASDTCCGLCCPRWAQRQTHTDSDETSGAAAYRHSEDTEYEKPGRDPEAAYPTTIRAAVATIPFTHPWLAEALDMNPSTKSAEELRATTITNFADLFELVYKIRFTDPTEALTALGVVTTPERPGLYGHSRTTDSYNSIHNGTGRRTIRGRFSSEHIHLIVWLAALGFPVETLSDWCSKAIADKDPCLTDLLVASPGEIEALKGAYYFLRKFFRLHAEGKDEELQTLLHKIFGSLYKPRTEDAS